MAEWQRRYRALLAEERTQPSEGRHLAAFGEAIEALRPSAEAVALVELAGSLARRLDEPRPPRWVITEYRQVWALLLNVASDDEETEDEIRAWAELLHTVSTPTRSDDDYGTAEDWHRKMAEIHGS